MALLIQLKPFQISIPLSSLQPITPAYIIQLTYLGLLQYAQCYLLLVHPERRMIRLAIWPAIVVQVLNCWLRYRFVYPGYNVFNFVIGCSAIYMIARSTEWALLLQPPARLAPLPAQASTSAPSSASSSSRSQKHSYLETLHLLSSPRMVGWSPGTPLADPSSKTNSRRLEGEKLGDGYSVPRQVNSEWERGRLLYHLKGAVVSYLFLDMDVFLFQHFGGSTVGNQGGGFVAQAKSDFLSYIFPLPGSTTTPTVVPSSLAPLLKPLASLAFTIVLRFLVGLAFYLGMAWGNHTGTAMAIGLLGWSAQEWPKFSDRPWLATSNFDFWGKRWHQLFRQAFIAPTRLVPQRYRPLATPIFAFVISATMHELGQITMAGHTSPNLSVTRFFLAAALGMLLETGFRKITGKRVGGMWGRVWFWTYLIWTGGLVVEPWVDMGVPGTHFYPKRLSLMRWMYKLVTGHEAARNDLGVSARSGLSRGSGTS